MRNLKKVLVLVLSLAMMLSIMVVGAGAAFTDQSEIDTKHTEAVDACVALNIINGYPNGTFKPNDTIKRSEMTKMICVLLNGGKDPVLGTGSTPFTDVPSTHWAAPYVQSCFTRGIVAGTSATTFNPEGQVKGVEEAKMLLVALGYNQDQQKYVGAGWEVAVNTDASAKGFYQDLEDIDPNAPISREHAAEMIWNALNAYEVEYKNTLATDANGQLTSSTTVQDRVVGSTNDKITLLEDMYECRTTTGILEYVKLDSDDGTYTTTVDENVAPFDTLRFDAAKDYSALMGQEVKVMYTFDNKTNEFALLGIYSTNNNKVVTGLAGDDGNDVMYTATSLAALQGSKVKYNDTEYELDSTALVWGPNGEVYTGTYPLAEYFQVCLVDSDKDKLYETIVVDPFDLAEITSLTSAKLNIGAVASTNPTKISFDLAKDDVSLYDGAAEDDYVLVRDSKYTVSGDYEITKADTVSGVVGSTKGSISDVRVDGNWSPVAANVDGDTIKLNDTYDFATANGYVFYADKVAGNISAENIVFINKAAALSSGLADGIEAEVYYADGSKEIVTLTRIYLPVDKDNHYVSVADTSRFNIVNDGAIAGPIDGDINNEDNYDGKDIAATTAMAYLNGQLGAGDRLFTYSKNSGEFAVEVVSDNNKGSYDNYLSDTGTVDDGKTANKYRFADDGVIFVKDNDGVKVVTGKTVGNWSNASTTTIKGLADKTNGTPYYQIGAIVMGAPAKTEAKTYGFITSSISTTKEDGDTYYNFTMWDGTADVDVKVTSPDQMPVKYGFASFDWADKDAGEADGDGFMVVTTSATNDLGTAATIHNGNVVAVKAFVTDDSITLWDNTTGTPVPYDFTDDFFVIGVDTDAGEGAPAKLATSKTFVDAENILGGGVGAEYNYLNAVTYIVDDGGTDKVECVFVDVNRSLYDSNGDELIPVAVP